MLKISKQKIDERWDVIPEILRESLCSFENGRIIWHIGKEQHLDDKKIGTIAALAGYVVYGLIQSSDLAKEIKTNLNLHDEIANSIAKEIESKIFSPIRSELEKNYNPSLIHKPVGDFKEHIVDLRTQKIETAVEKEIQKTEPEKIIPSKPAPIQQETMPVGEAPLIIHKEMESKPVLGAKRPLSGFFSALSGKKEEAGPITAQIETFIPEPPIEEQLKKIKIMPEEKKSEPSEPKIIHEEPPKPREVHYSDLRTPIVPVEPIKTEVKKEIFQQKEIKMPEPFPKMSEIISPIKKPVRKGIFSRLFSLFFSKEKTLKEIPSQDTTAEIPLPKIMAEIKPEIKKEQLRPEIKPVETPRSKIFAENLPIPPVPPIKPVVEIPIKPPLIPSQPEAVKTPPPIPPNIPAPKTESPKTAPLPNEEVIDLRTFEKFKK